MRFGSLVFRITSQCSCASNGGTDTVVGGYAVASVGSCGSVYASPNSGPRHENTHGKATHQKKLVRRACMLITRGMLGSAIEESEC